MKKAIFFLILCLLVPLTSTYAQEAVQPDNAAKINAAKHFDKPYVILISLDGFRYDYIKKYNPPHLSAFIKNGVAAESLIPCFPSKTFPNHYSIATGMYPENHGLVDNTFWSEKKQDVYRIGDREKVEDGSWYGGIPLWVQAGKEDMVSASFFFVGSEAPIQGLLPTRYYYYDRSISNETRTRQVISWLQLPPEERPHLITLYFSDTDNTGHRFGPSNEKEIASTIMSLDSVFADFLSELDNLNLNINVIFVSDHGMMDVPGTHFLPFEPMEEEERWKTVNGGAMIHFYLNEGEDIEKAYQDLKKRENHCTVYITEKSPFFKANQQHPHIGEIIAVTDPGYYFSDARRIARYAEDSSMITGQHGFTVDNKEMHGIFYAKGPALKSGKKIDSFENIHVYPLICQILDLPIPEVVDGKKEVLSTVLKKKYRK